MLMPTQIHFADQRRVERVNIGERSVGEIVNVSGPVPLTHISEQSMVGGAFPIVSPREFVLYGWTENQ